MSTVAISDRFCQIQEAAKIIGCTRARVRQLLIGQEIKGEKVGQHENAPWLIERESVFDYKEKTKGTTVGRKRKGEAT